MSGRLVVKRYVNALVDAGAEAGVLDTVEKDMTVLSEIMKEETIRNFCLKTADNRKMEMEFVRTAFVPYVGEYTGRFVTLMAENGRIAALPFVKDAFDEIMNNKKGITPVFIETADEPDKDVIHLIEENMRKRIKGKVVLAYKVNPSLLGGIRILWQNRIIDMSLRGKFNRVRNILKQERI